MVNLRGIANRFTSAINPNLTVQRHAYSGYARSPSGKVKAGYAAPVAVVAQVQALTKAEIQHIDNMNLSPCDRAAYVNGQLNAFDRVEQKGGDLLEFEGAFWMVMAVLEGWTTAGWMKVALTKQNGGPT
jgi:hypothetical protein